jgi:integrase/recombinase XerD
MRRFAPLDEQWRGFLMSKKRITTRKNVDTQSVTEATHIHCTFQELTKIFLIAKKVAGKAPRSLKDFMFNFQLFERWLEQEELQHLIPVEYDAGLFRSYISYMTDKYTPSTVNTRLTSLKSLFKFLAEEGMLPHNPLQRIPKVVQPETEIHAFTNEQVDALLEQPDKSTYFGFRDYVIMTLMLDTGIRINEVLSLAKKDVDLVQRQLTIVGAKSKNRRSRIVPFSKRTSKLLQELIAETETYFDIDQVFVSSVGTPLCYTSIYSNIRKYGKSAGIDEARVSPHTFRHTFSKMYIMNGGSAFSLQRILGHSTLMMTKRYIDLNIEDLHLQHAQFSPLYSLVAGKRRR